MKNIFNCAWFLSNFSFYFQENNHKNRFAIFLYSINIYLRDNFEWMRLHCTFPWFFFHFNFNFFFFANYFFKFVYWLNCFKNYCSTNATMESMWAKEKIPQVIVSQKFAILIHNDLNWCIFSFNVKNVRFFLSRSLVRSFVCSFVRSQHCFCWAFCMVSKLHIHTHNIAHSSRSNHFDGNECVQTRMKCSNNNRSHSVWSKKSRWVVKIKCNSKRKRNQNETNQNGMERNWRESNRTKAHTARQRNPMEKHARATRSFVDSRFPLLHSFQLQRALDNVGKRVFCMNHIPCLEDAW